jgi:hypothetical protein
MNTIHSTRDRISDAFGNSWRFWELGRIPYNALLFIVATGWLVFTWPHFRPSLSLRAMPPAFVLALIANLCYTAAYLADIPLLYSPAGTTWRRWRWALWVAGMLLAIALEMYWIADEIYPDPLGS